MFDPCTQCWSNRLFTVWHRDRCRDGSDDSCGWFMRARHCDQGKLAKIAEAFDHEWSHGVPVGWFAENGEPNYSPQAITIAMFRIAANYHFGHWSRRANDFLRKHVYDILFFAENSCDSMYTFIVQPYGRDKNDTPRKRAGEAACIIYSYICRLDRPWYRHPRYHFWHWQIQVHAWQRIVRRCWLKCSICGKRGFRTAPITNWEGSAVWHQECDPHIRTAPDQMRCTRPDEPPPS